MKKLLFMLLIAGMAIHAHAQKWEVTLQGGTTLSHFSGDAATNNAGLVESYNNGTQYYFSDNPHGKKMAFGYSAGLQTQFVSKDGLIAGLGASYELLRSKTAVDKIFPIVLYPVLFNIYTPVTTPVNGSVYLSNRFINLSPYIGYRVKFKTTSWDILPGMEIGIPLSSHEKGTASDANRGYTVNNKLIKPLTDVRVKLGTAFNYGQYSINAAYAYGVTNYDRNVIGTLPSLHSEVCRLGIGYRLN